MVTLPLFLQNETESVIRGRMFTRLPPDLDRSEGSAAWDLMNPLAIELAQVAIRMQEVLRRGFASTTFGPYLDLRAAEHGLYRIMANISTGTVRFTGNPGVLIPTGTVVATTSNAFTTSQSFITTTPATVTSSGIVDVSIQSVNTGSVTNAPAGSVIVMIDRIAGLTSVTNPLAFAGGRDLETDKDFYNRYVFAVQNPSSGGNIADYKTWALANSSVGGVSVVPTPNNVAGTVSVAIINLNKTPSSQSDVDSVQNFIAPPITGIREAEAFTVSTSGQITAVNTDTLVATGNLANPAAAPTPVSTATTGGTISAGTYLVGFTYVNSTGETALSPTSSQVTTGATSTITINLPTRPTGAATMSVYMSLAGGTTLYRYVAGITAAGALVITANTTAVNPAPATNSTAAATTLAAGSYTVGHTDKNLVGVSTLSPTAAVTIAAGQMIGVTVPVWRTGVTSRDIYVSSTAGSATLLFSTTVTSPTLTVNVSTLPTGAAPPTVNTTSAVTIDATQADAVATSVKMIYTPVGSTLISDPLKTANVANPITPPSLTATASATSLAAGTYGVAYAWRTQYGTTAVSPIATITITSGQQINVNLGALPSNVTSADIFFSIAVNNSSSITFNQNTVSATSVIINLSQPGSILPPSTNTALVSRLGYVDANGIFREQAGIWQIRGRIKTNSITSTNSLFAVAVWNNSLNNWATTRPSGTAIAKTNFTAAQSSTLFTNFSQDFYWNGTDYLEVRVYRLNTASVTNPATGPTLAVSTPTPLTNLLAGTYSFQYVWNTDVGSTLPSPIVTSATITAGQQITLTLPVLPAGVISTDIYMSGTVNDTTHLYYLANTTGTTYVVTSMPLSTIVPPVVNTTAPDTATIVWVDEVNTRSTFSKSDGSGKAPIGARVTVQAANNVPINVTATLTLSAGTDPTTTYNNIKTSITTYLQSIAFTTDNSVKVAKIGNSILSVTGVLDYNPATLTLNGLSNTNIILGPQDVATLGATTFS